MKHLLFAILIVQLHYIEMILGFVCKDVDDRVGTNEYMILV